MVVKVKKKKKKKIAEPQNIGILVEGAKKSIEQMAKSIIAVLDAVHKNEFRDEVAIAAMGTLRQAVKVDLTTKIEGNAIYMKD